MPPESILASSLEGSVGAISKILSSHAAVARDLGGPRAPFIVRIWRRDCSGIVRTWVPSIMKTGRKQLLLINLGTPVAVAVAVAVAAAAAVAVAVAVT